MRQQYEALQQEYANYRRRTTAELEQKHLQGMCQGLAGLLCVYDDLHRAVQQPCSDVAYHRGVEMMLKNMTAALEDMGVAVMDCVGKAFDPAFHEAVGQKEDASKPVQTICQVIADGFLLEGRVIRHARVIVTK